jgi:subtilisin family serine protease
MRHYAPEPGGDHREALDLVRLPPLMERSHGRPEIVIALVDGPVAPNHTDLVGATIRTLPGGRNGTCASSETGACTHATVVAGILCARRGSMAPAICPGCTLLLCPIYEDTIGAGEPFPSATLEELAQAITDSVDAGARIINLSSAIVRSSRRGETELAEALNHAAYAGVLVVAASGNQGTVGSTAITRHPWVIAVAACDRRGHPLSASNFANSIGRWGLSAPGEGVTSRSIDGTAFVSGGTSVAAPFVTGALALAWSEFPHATGSQVRSVVTHAHPRRPTIIPPVLNAWAIYKSMRELKDAN